MADTYVQMHIHLVFATKNRDAIIAKEWKIDLEKYITGIVQNHRHKMLAIKSVSDHIHIFIGYNVNHLIPNLVEEIKTSSNKWINQNKLSPYKFEWQQGYGCFSHSQSQVESVSNYIMNQEEHHRKKTFKEEYLKILNENEMKYNDKYIFDFFEI